MEETNEIAAWNVYCDESCHLLHDQSPVMGFGYIAIPCSQTRQIAQSIRTLKTRHGCRGELKWGKVSSNHIGFYLDLVDLFFSTKDLNFRAVVVRNKKTLNHQTFNHGSHDEFYYKMYYYLLRSILETKPTRRIRAYLDIKDTKGALKIHHLADVLAKSAYDFERKRLERLQLIRSHESEFVQLADFLLGAVTYSNRGLTTNIAKLAVIKRIKEASGYDLRMSTEPWETKFNLFQFRPRQDMPHA